MQIIDCEQGSSEWLEARAGIVTASGMQFVMAKGQGKTRETYMYKLIGEIMTGDAASNYTNSYMEDGHLLEDDARRAYEESHGCKVDQVGFIRNHDDIGGVGFSPDGLVGDTGSIEIKSKLAHLQVSILLANKVPPEHMKQLQCGLWVSEREWIDFIAYSPNMPMLVKRVHRDEGLIKKMKDEVNRFYDEMTEKLERIAEIGVAA